MKCKICNDPRRQSIETDMRSEDLSPTEIGKKYGLYPQAVTNHSPHIAYDIKARLEELIRDSLKSKVPPDSIGDLARLLSEFRAFTALEDKCKTCTRVVVTNRTIEEALRDFLEPTDGGDEDIVITVEENELFKAWLRTLPPTNELRKKYELYELKIQ